VKRGKYERKKGGKRIGNNKRKTRGTKFAKEG
jgi:hypothetical protein